MPPTNRRQFLRQSAALGTAAALTTCLPQSIQAEDNKPATKIIDCHTHFWHPDTVTEARKQTSLPEHYQAVAEPLGVTGTVVVEASPRIEDNQWILDLAAENPFLLGLIGHLYPGQPEFPAHLQRFAKNPLFRGIRVNQGDLEKGLEDTTYQAHIQLLADHDLTLDVNGRPQLLPLVDRLAQRLPKLKIVVNHLANVPETGQAPDDYQPAMQSAARHPNVYCKVSALVESARHHAKKVPQDINFYRPILDIAWTTFGEDRLIYASNWPVCLPAGSYAEVQKLAEAYFAEKSAEAREKFFWKNSQEAYGWVDRQ